MSSQDRRRAIATVAIALAALAFGGGRAKGQAFGQAAGYTEFIFGDSTRHGDTTGSVAIGGKADFLSQGSFTVENANSTLNTLVVGQSLTGQFGTIGSVYQSGNVFVGSGVSFSDPTIDGHLSVNGTVNLNSFGTVNGSLTYFGTFPPTNTTINGPVTQVNSAIASPINFSTTQTILTALSAAQYNKNDPTVAGPSGGTLNFVGTSAGTNFFNVSGSLLAGATGIDISAPAGSTVVINVDGTNDVMPNTGYSLTNVAVDHVLFNFYQASKLTIGGSVGSVLAPLAAATFPQGAFDGELIAASLTGGGETHVFGTQPGDMGHLTPFDGTLRPVPEPASLALMAAGGLGLIGYAWRGRRAS